jgi:hypothetical protein
MLFALVSLTVQVIGVDRYANRTELFAQRERGHRGSERHGRRRKRDRVTLRGVL